MRKIIGFIEKRGSALLITLLVITTLIGLTVGFSEESSIELNLSGFARDGHRAYQMARSGVHLALAVLHKDENKDMDSLREDWGQFDVQSFPFELSEGGAISGGMVDESGKFNINSLINEEGEMDEERAGQLLRLFRVLGFEEKMATPLLDWLDSDDDERMDGAETFYYQNLQEPYACANGPLLTIEQIFLVKGFKEMRQFGDEGEKRLFDFLTIYSEGKVNVNTASSEILQSLSDNLDISIAEAIIEFRSEEDFLKADDLKKVSGVDEGLFNEIKEWITVKSSVFSIEIQGGYQEAVARIKAIALREEDRLRLIYWQVI
jgi:general secretion pathway protein K